MVEETRRILHHAINSKTPNHRISVGLTEAEAAAVYAGNEHYQVRPGKSYVHLQFGADTIKLSFS